MNWADTPLLVYLSVEGHPARKAMQVELQTGEWGSSVLVLLQVFQVLTRDYAVSRAAARAQVEVLARSPVAWSGVSAQQAAEAMEIAEKEAVASTDAVLLHLAEKDRGVLVTPDARLIRAAQARGVTVRNPIGRDLAELVASWEASHLPEKGASRLLGSVFRWLAEHDPSLADRFREATGNLSRWP